MFSSKPYKRAIYAPLYTLFSQVLFLCLFLLMLCTIARGIMVWHYIPRELWQAHLSDFYAMWFMGFKLDMRAIGIALLGFMGLRLAGFLLQGIKRCVESYRGGGGVMPS